MSEIAGDAFFLGLLFKISSREHNHPPYSGGVHTTRTHPSTLCCSKISNNKISGIWNKILSSPWICFMLWFEDTWNRFQNTSVQSLCGLS